jgi:PAS domain S-box-containing protein
MLRVLSIRSRLMVLSLLLITSLIVTNLVLINQTRLQNGLIAQQARNLDLIVRADAATQTFGDLKYWLTDLALSQLVLSEQNAQTARQRLTEQLAELERDLPDPLAGLAGQLEQLSEVFSDAAESYARDDHLVGNALMARGRGHILAVDSVLATLVDGLRAEARRAAEQALPQTERDVRAAMIAVVLVTLLAVVLTLLILHSVASPLREMVAAIRGMSAGRMDVPIPAAGRDEVGEVARVLGLFRESVIRREQAEKTEARLREVIENISEGFGLYDSDDRLVLSNRRYRERLHHESGESDTSALIKPGMPFETIVRATAESGMIPEAEGRLDDWVAARVAHHRTPSGPLVQLRGDGSWVQISEYKTADDGRVAIYTDITELKRHEEELAEKTAILEATLENMGEGISLFDADLKLIVHNGKFLDLWDYPAERFKVGARGEDFLRYNAERGEYGPGDIDALVAQRLEVARHPAPQVYEHVRPNGKAIEIRRTPLPDGGFVTTYTDISERKRAEDSLREANRERDRVLAELQAVLDSIEYGVLFMDAELRIRLANRAYRAIWDMPEDFFANMPSLREDIEFTRSQGLYDLGDEEFDDFVAARIAEITKADASPVEQHLANGKVLQRRCIALPDGGRMATYFDITELKNREAELAEAVGQKDRVLGELHAVLDAIDYGILFMDADLKVRMDNRAYREIWEIPEGFYAANPNLRDGMAFARGQGLYQVSDQDWEDYAAASIDKVREGDNSLAEQRLANGKILQRRCVTLPDGGRMATYYDITELKRAEEALREASREKDLVLAELNAVLDAIDYGILFMDAELRVRMENRAYREIWHVPEGFYGDHPHTRVGMEFVRRQGLYQVPDEQWEDYVAASLAQTLEGDSTPVEQRLTNGTVILRRIFALPDGGRMATYFDITEVKRAEAALRLVLDAIEYGVLFMDSDLKVRIDNRAYRELWGIPEDFVEAKPHMRELIEYNRGKGIYDVPEEEWEDYVGARLAAVRKGGIAPFEFRRADGKVIQYQCMALPDGGRMLTYFDITELKRAEEALRESEERLNAVVDHMPATVFLRDTEGRYILINRQYEEICRVGRDEARGKSVYDILEGELAEESATHDREVIEQGRAIERELTLPLADGLHDFAAVKFPVLDPSGKIAAVGGVELDITERKRAEETLRRQARTLEQLYDAVIVVNLDERIVDWNPAAERIFGYSKDEMLGKTTAGLYESIEEARRLTAEMKQRMERDGRWVGECDNYRKDGTLVRIEAVVFPLHNEHGERVSTIGVSRDITDRKRAEAARRESEERLNAVVDNMPATVFLRDLEGRYILINRQYEAHVGISRDEVRGKTVHDILPKDIAEETVDHDREVLEQDRAVERELVFPLEDGPHILAAAKFPLHDSAGRIVSIGGVELDITRLKRAEQELIEAKEQAEVANEAKSQFLANMSHELRTPLNAIIGYTELMVDRIYGELPEPAAEVVGRVETNARHLLGMINDVLDLSKIEAGRFSLTLEDYSMKEVVDTVMTAVESLGAEKGLSLKSEVPDDLSIGRGDEQRIAQVLLNLVGNAIKFTDDGEVSVGVRQENGEFLVEVSDTGVGIAPAVRDKIFEEFGQADDSSTREQGGTGLGLAIAKRMVELHGGRLWVDSEPGAGSTFSFSLPVRVEQKAEAK